MAPFVHVVSLAEAMYLCIPFATSARARHWLFARWAGMRLPSPIFKDGHEFQVIGADTPTMQARIIARTRWIIRMTAVIPFKALRRLADQNVMREHGVATGISIASLRDMAAPKPTGFGFLDTSPEALFRCGVRFLERLTFWRLAPALVMHLAQAVAVNGTGAFRLGAGNGTLGAHQDIDLLVSRGRTLIPSRPLFAPSILPEGAF